MAYTAGYYDHYPKVALGNWPPGFYAIQALWTLTFSVSRTSVMVLMAVLTSMTALVVYRALLHAFDWRAAVFGSMLFVSFGLIQQYGSMVMTEIPVALFSTTAMIAFGRWLDHQRTRDSVIAVPDTGLDGDHDEGQRFRSWTPASSRDLVLRSFRSPQARQPFYYGRSQS